MHIFCAGGLGEHGRNCFLASGERIRFVVDCGVMNGAAANEAFPRLAPGRIAALDCVFLTHSHADHVGALGWLYEHGFHGPVFLSRPTLEQVTRTAEIPREPVVLEDLAPPLTDVEIPPGLRLRWGRSGHCAGAVWLRIEAEGRSLLFSGDYVEETLVYACDPLRGVNADVALLDCAYGPLDYPAEDCRALLKERTGELLAAGRSVAFPVPRHGRGLELAALFQRAGLGPIHADAALLREFRELDQLGRFWAKPAALPDVNALRELSAPAGGTHWPEQRHPGIAGIFLLADPQLGREQNRNFCADILTRGGAVLLTGHCDKDSYSAELLTLGLAEQRRYPAHQGVAQMKKLCANNAFSHVLPVHSAQMTGPELLEL